MKADKPFVGPSHSQIAMPQDEVGMTLRISRAYPKQQQGSIAVSDRWRNLLNWLFCTC